MYMLPYAEPGTLEELSIKYKIIDAYAEIS
jgi:hypothetical protein